MLTKEPWIVDRDLVEQSLKLSCNSGSKIVLNSPSGDFFYDKWVIKEEYSTTAWKKILDYIPDSIGEARVIKLVPGECYMAHADIDDRWHLNLQGEYSFLIDLCDSKQHLLKKDYQWYLMDAGRIHVAANFGSIDRIQLVVRKLLTRTMDTALVSIAISPSGEKNDYRYKFDNVISPFLNYANKRSAMTDFYFDRQTVSFKLLREELEKFKEIITEDFEVTYA